MNNESTLPEDKDISTKFGEYANPSFEAQIETVSKGKTGGVMSIEASVDELYGDSKTEEWKQQEVQRLKSRARHCRRKCPSIKWRIRYK